MSLKKIESSQLPVGLKIMMKLHEQALVEMVERFWLFLVTKKIGKKSVQLKYKVDETIRPIFDTKKIGKKSARLQYEVGERV